MGYRTRLMKLPKEQWIEYKDKTEEELGDDWYWREIPYLEELHEIGKSWDFDDETHIERFFTHKMGWEEDMEFSIANKEFLLDIIENYKQKIINYHQDLYDCIKDVDEKELREYKLKRILGKGEYQADGVTIRNTPTGRLILYDVQNYFRSKLHDWRFGTYSLDEEKDEVVTSYTYEYIVFDLVRILKTFDWENDILIWSGS